MQVQARGVNTKRHTTAYKIGGVWRSRAMAVSLARQNLVEGVIVARGGSDKAYLTTKPNSPNRMYDLPVLTEKQIRRNTRGR